MQKRLELRLSVAQEPWGLATSSAAASLQGWVAYDREGPL